MRILIAVILALTLTTGFAFASGDKSHGSNGSGETSTGGDAQGAASQSRAGR